MGSCYRLGCGSAVVSAADEVDPDVEVINPSDGWSHGARYDETPRRRPDYFHTRQTSVSPTYTPHDNLGILTLRLTQQRRFLRELVMEGLAIGLVARDAVDRATSALEYVRLHARSAGLDSGAQKTLRWFCRAALRSQGAEGGGVLGARAIEAARLMEEFLDKAREKEKKDARRGKVDE